MIEAPPNLPPPNKGNLIDIVMVNDGSSYSYLFLCSYRYLKYLLWTVMNLLFQYKTLGLC